jgi:hypothetical protein
VFKRIVYSGIVGETHADYGETYPSETMQGRKQGNTPFSGVPSHIYVRGFVGKKKDRYILRRITSEFRGNPP